MAEDRLSFLKTQLIFPQSLYNRPKWNLVLKHVRQLNKDSEILDIGFGYPFLSNFVGGANTKYMVSIMNLSFCKIWTKCTTG